MRIILLFLLTCLSVPLLSSAQNFSEALFRFQHEHPQEKIFIHFDKDGYFTGETIWFKAYLFHNSLPSLISTNFYVQLQNENGEVIINKKYPVNGATVKAELLLPDSLPPGLYNFHAFTPAGFNYLEPDLAYRKQLYLADKYTQVSGKEEQKGMTSLQFFPEGGNLIHGLMTQMAFKAVDEKGRPVEFTGRIQTLDGFAIPIKTTHNGMGKVSFKPDASKKYRVTISNSNDSFPLPSIERSGILLHVEDEKGGKQFTITRSTQNKNLYQHLKVLAQIHNQVVYEQEIDFEDYPSIKGHLLTDKLASGILHITVFNQEGIPLAERLSFVDNSEYLASASIQTVQQNLGKKGENIIQISSSDSLQQSLSLSITDISVADTGNRESILSRFLLTADLAGPIHDPAAYFEKPFDSVRNELDLLMMTHGWRRFSWKKILNKEFVNRGMAEPYLLSLRGFLKDEKDRPVRGGELNLFIESEDSTTQNYEIRIDENGSFLLDSLIFYGQTRFHYSYFQNGRLKQAFLSIDSSLLDTIPAVNFISERNTYPVFRLSSNKLNQVFNSNTSLQPGTKTLEPVLLETSTLKTPFDLVNEKYTHGAFRSRAKVNLDNITQPTPNRTINPLDYAMNNIRLLEIQGGRLVNNRTMSLMSGEKWTVAVFLDEIPVDLNVLRTYRMDEIALIKYYDPGFVGAGSSGPGGALAVYTRQQKSTLKNQRMEFIIHQGYAITREFYHPDYGGSSGNQNLPDYRTTIYWNPDIFLDEANQNFQVRFFNNDISKKLRLVLEGFTANGKLIHIEKILE